MLAERERQRAENDAIFDDTQEHTPSTSTEDVIHDENTILICRTFFCWRLSTFQVEEQEIDLERLRRLQRNVRENERKQKYYSSLLEVTKVFFQ